MANVVLPQVSILNSLANDANLLVEQNGEINRFAVTDLDIGGGDVTIDLASGISSVANPIDADTLNGYEFDYFASKNDLSDYATAEQVEEIIANLPKDDLDIKLNYSVVGGTTQPSNPTENMIWVNTDQTITGHCFNQNEPKEFQEGMIWIKLGFRSHISFYKIQINEIGVEEIYPLQTYQRLNDSWVIVPTAIYQNNIWNYFLLYLYHNGDEFNNITGGWKADSVNGSTYTKNKTYMQIKVTSGVSSNKIIHNNVLALDSIYDYLCFDLDVTNNNDHILLCYTSTAGSTLASKKITGNQSRQIFKIPITGINTPGYVKCDVNGDSLTTFYSIWLE